MGVATKNFLKYEELVRNELSKGEVRQSNQGTRKEMMQGTYWAALGGIGSWEPLTVWFTCVHPARLLLRPRAHL